VESQASEKVDIARIFIQAVDGPASTARVTSMEAANSVLQGWAHRRAGVRPAKCEVEIVFEDGLRYCSLYRLTEQEKSVSLSRHVRRQLTAMTKAKGKCIKRDQQPANEPAIHPNEPDPAERAKAMLARYNI
jgi:hypothetical protein